MDICAEDRTRLRGAARCSPARPHPIVHSRFDVRDCRLESRLQMPAAVSRRSGAIKLKPIPHEHQSAGTAGAFGETNGRRFGQERAAGGTIAVMCDPQPVIAAADREHRNGFIQDCAVWAPDFERGSRSVVGGEHVDQLQFAPINVRAIPYEIESELRAPS